MRVGLRLNNAKTHNNFTSRHFPAELLDFSISDHFPFNTNDPSTIPPSWSPTSPLVPSRRMSSLMLSPAPGEERSTVGPLQLAMLDSKSTLSPDPARRQRWLVRMRGLE